jgi:hypothetical protein
VFFLVRCSVARKGVSDIVATILLVGLFIVLAISIIFYTVSSYTATETAFLIRDVLEKERNSIVARIITDNASNSAVILFKGLQNKSAAFFFLDNGKELLNCSALELIGGGSVAKVKVSLSSLKALWSGEVTEFSYYARAFGLPQSGEVEVCSIGIENYRVAKINLVQAVPTREGYEVTVLNSSNRAWRLAGTVQFKVIYLDNPNEPHMRVGETPIVLSLGDVVRIDVDTITGKMYLAPGTLPSGQQGIWINTLSVYASAVYLNGALVAKNQLVEFTPSVVAVSTADFSSSLAVEIYPQPPGFVRLVYGSEKVIENWNDGSYIRVEGWSALNPNTGEVKPAVLQLSSDDLDMAGYAYAIYIGQSSFEKIDRLRLYIVSFVNGVPYVVDVYDYSFR